MTVDMRPANPGIPSPSKLGRWGFETSLAGRAGAPEGAERDPLEDRAEAQAPSGTAEAVAGRLILDLEHGLALPHEGRERSALVVLKALLDHGEIERPGELAHLPGVVLQPDGESALVGLPCEPAVEPELVRCRERESGGVRVAVDVVRVDAVEVLVPAGVHAVEQDRAEEVEAADVEPALVGEALDRPALHLRRKPGSVRPVRLVAAGREVADDPAMAAMQPPNRPSGRLDAVDVVHGGPNGGVDFPAELELPRVRRRPWPPVGLGRALAHERERQRSRDQTTGPGAVSGS